MSRNGHIEECPIDRPVTREESLSAACVTTMSRPIGGNQSRYDHWLLPPEAPCPVRNSAQAWIRLSPGAGIKHHRTITSSGFGCRQPTTRRPKSPFVRDQLQHVPAYDRSSNTRRYPNGRIVRKMNELGLYGMLLSSRYGSGRDKIYELMTNFPEATMSVVTWHGSLQPDACGSLRRPGDGDTAVPRPYPALVRTGVSWS
jgi:hypothetical protein